MNMLDAKAIREIRLSLGMTQTEFAVAIGKSYPAVCKWEAGLRHPTYATMLKINELAQKAATKQKQAV